MCFTLFKIGAPSDDYKLILGFNRDELFHRPTGPAAFWTVDPRILAATDLDPKNPPWGTWLGASTTGKIGFITNYTVAPEMVLAHAPTRGTLVTSFLRGDASPQAYTASISSQELLAFNGFNLVVIDAFSDEVSASYLGNREHKPHKSLGPGCYCLSNRTLDDASWPKVEFGKQSFESFVATPRPRADLAQGLFDILHDGTRHGSLCLPELGEALEHVPQQICVWAPVAGDGTRTTTVVLVDRSNHVYFEEQNLNLETMLWEKSVFEFDLHR